MTPTAVHLIRDNLTIVLLCLEELDRELPGRRDLAAARVAIAKILDALPRAGAQGA